MGFVVGQGASVLLYDFDGSVVSSCSAFGVVDLALILVLEQLPNEPAAKSVSCAICVDDFCCVKWGHLEGFHFIFCGHDRGRFVGDHTDAFSPLIGFWHFGNLSCGLPDGRGLEAKQAGEFLKLTAVPKYVVHIGDQVLDVSEVVLYCVDCSQSNADDLVAFRADLEDFFVEFGVGVEEVDFSEEEVR